MFNEYKYISLPSIAIGPLLMFGPAYAAACGHVLWLKLMAGISDNVIIIKCTKHHTTIYA